MLSRTLPLFVWRGKRAACGVVIQIGSLGSLGARGSIGSLGSAGSLGSSQLENDANLLSGEEMTA
jgi:hypothetical protein